MSFHISSPFYRKLHKNKKNEVENLYPCTFNGYRQPNRYSDQSKSINISNNLVFRQISNFDLRVWSGINLVIILII